MQIKDIIYNFFYKALSSNVLKHPKLFNQNFHIYVNINLIFMIRIRYHRWIISLKFVYLKVHDINTCTNSL